MMRYRRLATRLFTAFLPVQRARPPHREALRAQPRVRPPRRRY